MNSAATVSTTMALALIACAAAFADAPTALQHNPFSRPPSQVTAETRLRVATDGTLQAPELRATMVGVNGSLANVAGRTLRPGDDIEGYTLLEVFEDRAIFLHGNRRLTVYVKPERIQNDD